MDSSSTKAGYIEAFLTVIIWSGFILVSRLGGKSALLPQDIIALRFGVATIILIPIWLTFTKTRLHNPKMLFLGLTGGIGYAALAYIGFKNAPAAHAAILLPGMLPFEIALFSWLILRERPSLIRASGLGVIGLGVTCLMINSLQSGFDTSSGDIAFILASSCWAIYSVCVRKWNVGVWDATIACALTSAFIYLPIYIFFLPKNIHMAPISMVALQAFYQGFMAVVVAMYLFIKAASILGPSKVGLFMAMVPVISGIAAVPLLNEALPPLLMLGLAFVSAGAWIGSKG